MRRRTLLTGVGGLGSILVVGRASQGAQGIDVRIAETNDPVRAGDYLDVTVEATNTTSADRRPAFEFHVGDDRRVTRTTTVPAGETTSFEFSHLTYPVTADVAFPVAVRTEATTAERTVEVTGIAELDESGTRPETELAVPPETSVLFEVEWDGLGEYGGRTRWYVDEEFAGWSQGPWYAAYYGAQGRDHLTQSFTAEGSYDVAAALRGDEANRTARWAVDVTPDAPAAPTIESTTPDAGPLEVASTETVDLEAAVSAPAGLDRAVWWLAHADVVLGVDELSGTEATTSLSTDDLCHGCPIVVWVIDERGAITEESLWTPQLAFDGESQLSIADTNAPVEAGADLDVTVDVTNNTDDQLTEALELVVGDEVVDTRSVSLDPNSARTVTLGYETYPVETDVSFPVLVRSDADRDSTAVDVFAEVGPAELTVLDANDPVLAGDRLAVDVEVTNAHDATITDTVHLVAGDRVDTTAVTLEPAESRVLTLGYDTYPVTVDVEFPIEVAGTGAHDRRSVRVYAQQLPSVRVDITGTNAPVAAGDFLEVIASVENTGDAETTDDVSLAVGGERVDGERVRLSAGEATQVELGYETYPVQQAVEFPITVESDGASDRQVVSVSPEEGNDGDQDEDEDDEQQADPAALELVDYRIEGSDPDDEYISLRNTADVSLDASGWRIEDDGLVPENLIDPFVFPAGVTLESGATVTVYTGTGSNTADTLYWGYERQIWAEDGDVVSVIDDNENAVIETPIAVATDGSDGDTEGDGENGDEAAEGAEAGPVSTAIDGTNAPVEGGERLNVRTTLTNQGGAAATRTVELVVGGEVIDGRSVTIPGDGTQSVVLGHSTYPVQQDVSFEVVVRTGDDSAATTVQVSGSGGESSAENSGSVAEEESGEGRAAQSDGDESAGSPDGNDSGQATPAGEQAQSAENESASGNASGR